MHISFTATGLSENQSRINIVAQASGNMAPAYRAVGEYLLDQARKRIEMGGDPPWAPTQYPSNLHPILRKTGKLINSLNPGNMVITTSGVILGESLPPYAAFLQQGTVGSKGRGNLRALSTVRKLRSNSQRGIPPRKFLYVSPADRKYIKALLRHYVLTGEILNAA
jgi:phage gpG-like protein